MVSAQPSSAGITVIIGGSITKEMEFQNYLLKQNLKAKEKCDIARPYNFIQKGDSTSSLDNEKIIEMICSAFIEYHFK